MPGHLDPIPEISGDPQSGTVVTDRRRTPAQWTRVYRTALYLAAWFAFLVAAVALAARFLPVTNHAVLALAASSPYLMGGAVVCACILLLTRQWWTASAALILGAVAVFVELPMFIGSAGAQADTVPVRVLTANLREGTANPKALATVARDRADLLIAVELTPELGTSLMQEGLDSNFPYKVLHAQPYAAGVAIWSRYPVLRSSRIGGYQLGVIRAAIRTPQAADEIEVVAAHLRGPWPQPIDGWRQDITEFADTVNEVAADAGDGVAIVAGDFNASMDMQPFRRLLESGFRDAAEQSGAGLTPTFPADGTAPPLIGIDRILTLNSSASDAQTVRIPGSDHLGLWAIVHVPH